MEGYVEALATLFMWHNVAFMLLGVMAGVVVGCLPGLTATMGMALLIPFTFTMTPETGLVMLGGLYVGAMYGDAIPAILLNTPGTPSAIATTFDGYPLSRNGQAQHGLVAAAFGSAVGGVIGALLLLTLTAPLARAALAFGPPEYFWMGIFGMTIIATLASGSTLKGMTGGALGLLLSAIGISPIAGDMRFTFGVPAFQGGVELIVALIGFFCVPQVFQMVEERRMRYKLVEYKESPGVVREVIGALVRKPILLLRSSVIGTIVGIIPGAGGNIASLVSYNEAVRWDKEPEKFGKGTVDGVAASEVANNAVAPGAMVPLLSLGIPGSPAAAVILGALLLHGLRPGPGLFTTFGAVTYTFIFAFLFGAIAVFFIGMWGSRYLARWINVPIPLLVPLIMVITVVGSFAIRNNIVDVGAMLFFGVVGYVTMKLGFHPGAIVLGLILGPIIEQGLVQSLLMGAATGSVWGVLFTRPISIVLIALSVVSLAWPLWASYAKRRRDGGGASVRCSSAKTH